MSKSKLLREVFEYKTNEVTGQFRILHSKVYCDLLVT
jgi:hypothetical protein